MGVRHWCFAYEFVVLQKYFPFVDLANLYVAPSSQRIEGKKVLAMEDDLSLYLENKTSSFFLDWNLYGRLLLKPDYYEHVIMVARGFNADPPEVIFDPNDRLKNILHYIPQIRQHYRHDGAYYIRIPD